MIVTRLDQGSKGWPTGSILGGFHHNWIQYKRPETVTYALIALNPATGGGGTANSPLQLRRPGDASSSLRTVCLPEAPCPSGTCEGGEFCLDEAKMLCNPLDKYCIDESLICDGVVNCGAFDHSDEEGCKIIMLDYVTVSVVASI